MGFRLTQGQKLLSKTKQGDKQQKQVNKLVGEKKQQRLGANSILGLGGLSLLLTYLHNWSTMKEDDSLNFGRARAGTLSSYSIPQAGTLSSYFIPQAN